MSPSIESKKIRIGLNAMRLLIFTRKVLNHCSFFDGTVLIGSLGMRPQILFRPFFWRYTLISSGDIFVKSITVLSQSWQNLPSSFGAIEFQFSLQGLMIFRFVIHFFRSVQQTAILVHLVGKASDESQSSEFLKLNVPRG